MVNTLLPTTVVGSYPQPGWLSAALLAVVVIALSGCAIALPAVDPVSDHHLRGHYVLAHEDGYPIALPALSGDGRATQERRLTRAELSPPQDREDLDARVVAGIDRHAMRLWSAAGADPSAAGPVLRLLVFAHGGLNGYDADFRRMRQMLAAPCGPNDPPRRLFVSQDCARARTDYYPIFINWNSGLPDAIVDNLFFIRFAQRHPEYGLFTWPFVLAGRLVESIFSAPAAWLASSRTYWEGERIEGQVRPYLAHPPDTGAGQPEFWTFTLTRHDEALERDWKTAILPRGTLLVWIDNFFEPVSEPGDNRAGRYRSHHDYYGRDAEAPTIAALNVCHWTDDARRRPTAHATIDDLPFLEGALFKVAPDAFRAPADIPPIEVACRVE